MKGKTAGNLGPRVAIALAVVAVVALLAATLRVHTQTSFATGAGPAGSASYRQTIAFVLCMRSHGVPTLPVPPPGDSLSVPLTPNAVGGNYNGPVPQAFDACKQLDPSGRDTTNMQITLLRSKSPALP